MIFANLRAGLWEVFTLRRASATIASYGPERLERVRNAKGLARIRLAASRRLANPVAALDLLYVAETHALEAEEEANISPPQLPPPDGAAGASFAQAEAQRDELETAISRSLARVESRTLAELRGLRVGRSAALGLALAALVLSLVHRYGVHDVALDKPVLVTSVRDGKPEDIVDGRTRGTYAVQTSEQSNPSITIDLGRIYRIRRVRVFNRGDGWFDEVLPLSIEVSVDGATFHELAKRTEHFDVWTIDAVTDARWVRATKDKGYIALNEIEVYARE